MRIMVPHKISITSFWQKSISGKDDKEEKIRQKRIDNIIHDVILLETMHRWERETRESLAPRERAPD
jgi:hypothetical protein